MVHTNYTCIYSMTDLFPQGHCIGFTAIFSMSNDKKSLSSSLSSSSSLQESQQHYNNMSYLDVCENISWPWTMLYSRYGAREQELSFSTLLQHYIHPIEGDSIYISHPIELPTFYIIIMPNCPYTRFL